MGYRVTVAGRVVAWCENEGDARAIAHRRGVSATVERMPAGTSFVSLEVRRGRIPKIRPDDEE